MSLQVLGVGLHRTGSLSVKVALERLGFGPCYHGFEYVRRRDHVALWQKAIDTDGAIDWDELFGSYRAAFDWPMIAFWDKVTAGYPEAKVLLTYRDEDSWYRSHSESLQALAHGVESQSFTHPVDLAGFTIIDTLLRRMFDDRLFDADHCRSVFRAHYQRVRDTIPADRLLVYQAADGWEPLCRFLGVPIPDEPFPRLNVRSVFIHNADHANDPSESSTLTATWL